MYQVTAFLGYEKEHIDIYHLGLVSLAGHMGE